MGILRTDKVSGLETPTPVTGSVSFDGDTDGLIVAENGDHFDFLSSDFTVECWIYPRGGSSSNFGAIYTKGYDYQLHWKDDTKRLETYLSSNGSSYTISGGTNTGSGSVPANKWSHIAHTREGSTFRLFVNGSLLSTITSSLAIGANTSEAGISDYTPAAGSYELDGDISNLRVLKGTALYTSDFTPPVHALEVIGDTVLLCCNNPDSVTAASYAGIGTSHIITTAGNPTVSTNNPSLTRDFTYGTEFNGVTTFDTQGYFVPPSGTTEQRGAGRAVFAGGFVNPGVAGDYIESININSLGNSTVFGTLKSNGVPTSTSSATRQLIAGGYINPAILDNIDYITIATSGNPVDFGTLDTARRDMAGVSNNTRSVFGGGTTTGSTNSTNVMDYVTNASLGSATPFGTLTASGRSNASCASPTRGMFFGGYQAYASPVSTYTNVINYITIATTGNGTDFGDITYGNSNDGKIGGQAAFSSSTRGVLGGGARYANSATALYNSIHYVTIPTLGNTQDFGDLSISKSYMSGSTNSVRGVFNQGSNPSYINAIEYVTIASTGNSQDFGDAVNKSWTQNNAGSDSHGGLS